jgi:PAS domain S-box-containing protein
MEDYNRSKEELINELMQLRKRNTELEKHFKQTEIALKEAEGEYRFKLEQEVNKRTTELEQLKEKLKQKTEGAFKETEEKFRFILENSRDIISMIDLKLGKHIYRSPSQVESTGFTEEEINCLSFDELCERLHPDDFNNFIKQYKLIASGIESLVDIEYRWKIKSGEYRWFSDKRKLIRDGKGQPLALVGVNRDITDRKEYEGKLALQSKILSNVNDAIIVVDENDRIIYCNNALLNLFGCQEKMLLGHSFFDLAKSYIDELSKEKILWTSEERHKAYSTSEENNIDGIKCYTKYGTQIVIDINRSVVTNSEGEFNGVIYSIRDVSERYKYQLKLKKAKRNIAIYIILLMKAWLL